jgi:hypothetical protein
VMMDVRWGRTFTGDFAYEERGLDFLIEDATGTVLVRCDRAKVRVERPHLAQSGGLLGPKATEEQERFLTRHNRKSRTGWIDDELTYLEIALEPGMLVSVSGRVALEIDPHPGPNTVSGYRETPMRPVLRADSETPLWISDQCQDAKTS